MQVGVINEEAAERARAKGVTVVMNRCPAIEFRRLFRPCVLNEHVDAAF